MVELANIPQTILVSNTFFFIAFNCVGMAVVYLMEGYARKDFLRRRELTQNQEALRIANEHLEEQVVERTVKLSQNKRVVEIRTCRARASAGSLARGQNRCRSGQSVEKHFSG